MTNHDLSMIVASSNGVVYKTKPVEFCDRWNRIVLHNGGGDSLLVALCNVLLLRGDLILDPTTTEVSQQNLISLVAEQLLVSDHSFENVEDVIELLPRLAAGIQVDVCFRSLFCLTEDLKEQELCIFLRNNHFSTMLKYKGKLYLLETDEAFINREDLLWKKLNEIGVDTVVEPKTLEKFEAENQYIKW